MTPNTICGAGDDDRDDETPLDDLEAECQDMLTTHESYHESRLHNPNIDVNADIDTPEIPTVLRLVSPAGHVSLVESRPNATSEEVPWFWSRTPISDPDAEDERE